MKKMINKETIIGRVYQHKLEQKTVKNQQSPNFGKDFIGGTIDVAVDEEGLNVVTVKYSYVTPQTKNGKENRTYTVLKKIIEQGKVWIVDGRDEATKVKLDTSLTLNEFYNNEGELVSTMSNEGGFADILNAFPEEGLENSFEVDTLLTSMKEIEANEEQDVQAHLELSGYIFNFRNEIFPVQFNVYSQGGIDYFMNLGISSKTPVFTKLWGKIESTTIKKTIEEETAFGEPSIKTIKRKVKSWNVSKALKEPYEYGNEEVLTREDMIKASQDRETKLAALKASSEERQGNASTTSASQIPDGNFQF